MDLSADQAISVQHRSLFYRLHNISFITMASDTAFDSPSKPEGNPRDRPSQPQRSTRVPWRRFLGASTRSESDSEEDLKWSNRSKWTLGILSDKETDEVPGKFARSVYCLQRADIV